MSGAVPLDWGHAIAGQMCQFCGVTAGFEALPSLRGGSACPGMERGRQMGGRLPGTASHPIALSMGAKYIVTNIRLD